MSISKFLSGAVFALCLTSSILHAAAPPADDRDKTDLERTYEGEIRERDEEIAWRTTFPLDRASVQRRVEALALTAYHGIVQNRQTRVAPVREKVEQRKYELVNHTVKGGSLMSCLQIEGSSSDLFENRAITDLDLMILTEYTTRLSQILAGDNNGAAQADNEEALLEQARISVITEVMNRVTAMGEEEFAKPNNERLRVLGNEKKKCEEDLAEERVNKEKRRRAGVWRRYDNRIDRSVLTDIGSLLVSSVVLLTSTGVSRIAYVKKKLDALQSLRQIDRERICYAFVGGWVATWLAVMHDLKVLLVRSGMMDVEETQDPVAIRNFCGWRAMLNYVLLDLGYAYGSDFIGSKLGHTKFAKKYSEIIQKYESRLRQRFKKYDFVKHKLGCAMKILMSFYGAREYINGSV